MAAKLQCEICGGKLIGRPGGIFECDSCGMEYDTSWAKEKIQEITGTVKVEGKVEVTGTVKLDSSANEETFLQRGYLALEDSDWEKAKDFFNQVLNFNAKNAEAYLGLAMADEKCKDKNALRQFYLMPKSDCKYNVNLSRCRQYGDEIIKRWFKHLDEEAEKEEQKWKQFVQAQKVQEKEVWETKRNQNRLCQQMISTGYCRTAAVRVDGSVLATGKFNNDDDVCRKTSNWNNIIGISVGVGHIVGLRVDGTLVTEGSNDSGQCNVSHWKNIMAVATGNAHTIGLKADGTVVATNVLVSTYNFGQSDVSGWRNIVAITTSNYSSYGLTADGTVVAAGKKAPVTELNKWRDIISIAAVDNVTDIVYGLTKDGTVIATGYNRPTIPLGNPVSIGASYSYYGVLTSDGKVDLPIADVFEWEGIVAFSLQGDHVIALKSDGRVIAAGGNKFHQCDVDGWRLFNSVEEVLPARERGAQKYQAELVIDKRNKIDSLTNERNSLQTELSNLNGLFSGRRRKEIQSRLTEIDAELNKLR